jgi:fatty acid CoA ligase FadD22
MNVAERLSDLAERQKWLTRTAYYTETNEYSHGWIHDMAARMSSVLGAQGISRSSYVIIALHESIEWVVVFLASARLGSVAVTVNPDLPAAEHRRLFDECTPDLIVSNATLADRVDDGRWADVERLMADARDAEPAPAAPVSGDDPLYVQFTSGTTGQPKGAIHRHADLAAYHHAVGGVMLEIVEDDISVSSSKIYHPYGFGNLFVYPLHSGSAAILRRDRLTPTAIARVVQDCRATILHAIPSIYSGLVAHDGESAFTTLRVAVSAGEPLPQHLGERAEARLGAPVLNELGSTEVGGAFCANTIRDNEPGTIGFPLPGYELELRDGETASPHEGRLWVRGPTVMAGYLHRPEETAAALVDRWLSTGDTARRRSDGRYVHTGRWDDVEIIGGLNLSPLEVETVLARHPAVHEVAVAAIVEHDGRRELCAFVALAGHALSGEAVAAELLELSRGSLAPIKVPARIVFVHALPRTYTGKLRRNVVRAGDWRSW